MIWECGIRPAVAERAYARNWKFEKREGRRPYHAPNPLRGGASSFAKASEDMSKGARDGWVGMQECMKVIMCEGGMVVVGWDDENWMCAL